jgi:CubicO group peptidase (beta-lactamase class C family)
MVLVAGSTSLLADEPKPDAVAKTSDSRPLAERIAELAQPLIDAEAIVGMSIGVIQDGRQETFGFGKLASDGDAVPNGQTVFEIGSITKVFTSIALADMAEGGIVKLDDQAQTLLPEGAALPQFGDTPITLAHLASHLSGLPRLPDNMAPADPLNPYADYNEERLLAFLKAWKPERKPEDACEYSNLGAGLLGYLLARKEGASYEQLVLDRIATPLKLTDLRIALDDSMRSRLARGHDVEGGPAANWDLDALAGAGGLRSTTDTMLAFLAANLKAEETPLAAALQVSRQPRHPLANGQGHIALGWHIAVDGQTVWHNGGTGGYHSLIAFDVSRQLAVVVLANSASGLVDPLGFGILRMLAGNEVAPIPVRKAVVVDEAVLAGYIGKYEVAPTFHIEITRNAGKLYLQATNQPKFRLFAESNKKFFLRVVDAVVEFETNDQGEAQGLVLFQGGQEIPGKRVEMDVK